MAAQAAAFIKKCDDDAFAKMLHLFNQRYVVSMSAII